MAKLLSGKPVAQALGERLQARSAALRAAGIAPALAILRIGAREDDLAYERGLEKRAARLGVEVRRKLLPADCGAEAVRAAIVALNRDETVHGVLVFRPFPAHLHPFEAELCALLAPEKDVDGMTPASMAGLYSGSGTGFAPCTAEACMELLDYYHYDCAGKRAVVIGRSLVIGKPVALLLLARNATVTVCHTRTRDLAALSRQADLIVTAAGCLDSLTAAHCSAGQTVLDVSVNWNEQTQSLCGDAEFSTVSETVGAITPVPGGVGAVTSTVLMAHVLRAAENTNPGSTTAS